MLDFSVVNNRQGVINSKVKDLCLSYLSDDDIDALIKSLLPLYDDGFRHSYSEFYPIISNAISSNSGDIDFLFYNLILIRDALYMSYLDHPNSINIIKLCDHLNLDASRLQQTLFYSIQFESLNQQIYSLSSELASARSDIDDLNSDLDESRSDIDILNADLEASRKKLERSQIDIISAMSIFSAVVLTFFGGINFISGSISAVSNTPILKLTFVVILAGDIMFNIIIGVLWLLNRIIRPENKPINPWFVIIVNVVLLLLMIGIVFVPHYFHCSL